MNSSRLVSSRIGLLRRRPQASIFPHRCIGATLKTCSEEAGVASSAFVGAAKSSPGPTSDNGFEMPAYKGPGDVEVTPQTEAVFKEILNLKPSELPIIGHILMQRLGISHKEMMATLNRSAQPGAGATGGAPRSETDQATAVEKEKTTFDVRLVGFDSKAKIKVIKEVRAITGLGLKEAKAVVEETPKSLKKGIKKEEAELLKKALEDIGAKIEIA